MLKREQYLDSLEKPLSRLPLDERREWRQEAAQHLEQMAQAHEELGATPEEALEAAIAQFGDAQEIARRIRQEAARRKVALSPIQAASGALCLLMLTATGVLAAMGALTILYLRGAPLSTDALRVAATLLFVLGTLLGGALLGRLVSRWRIVPGRDIGGPVAAWGMGLIVLLQLWTLAALDGVMGAFASSISGAPEIDMRWGVRALLLSLLGFMASAAWSLSGRKRPLRAAR